jgi:hypothetical protein
MISNYRAEFNYGLTYNRVAESSKVSLQNVHRRRGEDAAWVKGCGRRLRRVGHGLDTCSVGRLDSLGSGCGAGESLKLGDEAELGSVELEETSENEGVGFVSRSVGGDELSGRKGPG